MENLKKMLKALELVIPEGVYSLGLVINTTGKRIMWGKMSYEIEKIDVEEGKDELELLKQIYEIIKAEKWLVLNLKTVMPPKMFTMLKQLSQNNRLQIIDKDEILELKQSGESRIIIGGLIELINQNEKEFQGFKNIFGPVITI